MSAKSKYSTHAQSVHRNAVFPLVQMGAYRVQQESTLVHRILRCLPPSCDVALTTGYFSPTQELETALIEIAQRSHRPASQIHVLCAAPEVRFFEGRTLVTICELSCMTQTSKS